MRINLEEQEKLITVIPGYAKFAKPDLFENALLGLTETELVLYSDLEPDSIKGEEAFYSIKERHSLNDIQCIIKEKVIKDKKYKKVLRLNVLTNVIEDSFFFYYDKKKAPKYQFKILWKRLKKKNMRLNKRKVREEKYY